MRANFKAQMNTRNTARRWGVLADGDHEAQFPPGSVRGTVGKENTLLAA